MNRRRFLCLTAVALASPAGAGTVAEWQGAGLGGALSLRLAGAEPHRARRTFARVEREVARIEAAFSLFRDSSLTRLNRDGRLAFPSEDFLALLRLAGQVNGATGGAFDPTIQPLWLAEATGGDVAVARGQVGWSRVKIGEEEIRLDRGQALTLNGIAQGWAADRITALIKTEGFGDALIDMGEIAALGHRPGGGDWTAGIASPDGRTLGGARLSNRALATSSPRGTLIGDGKPHIIGPFRQFPRWSTVSVSAPSAALADALSTGFCLMERPAIDRALAIFPQAKLELLA